MLEDIGIGVAKLLVVLDVKVYRPIHQHLQPVLVHQAHKTLSGMWVVSSSSLWNALGHTWCQLCYRTPWIRWLWHIYDSSRLSVQESTLHSSSHNGDCRRNSMVVSLSCLKATWTTSMCCLRLWALVYGSVHKGTLQAIRYMIGLLHGLAPVNGQTNGAHQPRVGPVPLNLCQRVSGWWVWPLTPGWVPTQ